MSYYGIQGIYSSNPTYRHRDGTVNHEPERNPIGYHDDCAHDAFLVDRSREGWGDWHHDLGMSWGPWLAGVACESCGKPC